MAIADTIQSMYENVDEVYDTITNVDVNTGKNLFNKDTITKSSYLKEDGTLLTGTAQEYNTSDFIPVEPNTAYYKTQTLSPRTKFYDANKQALNTTTYQDVSIGGNAGTFTTPSNAHYFRFTIDTNPTTGANINLAMVNKGTTALPYEPYTDNPTYKNIENIPKVIRNSYLEIMNNGIDKIWNNWEKVEGTGETLTLNSTEKAPMKINLKGNTSQETTTGKNVLSDVLLPVTMYGITISKNDNGDIVINGTPNYSNGYRTFNIGNSLSVEEGTYTISVANKKVGLGINVGGFGGSLNLTMSDTVTTKTLTSNQAHTIKPQINIRYDAGTFDNYVFNPMLEKSSTATDYEPYTGGQPSPNPDYPQDIHVVTGDNSIKVEGKNLLTTLNATSTNKQTTISVSNGIIHDTTSKTGNTEYADVFSFTNVISYGNYGGYVIPQGNIIELEAGTYTFSYHKISGTAPTYDDASKSRNINVYKYGSSTPYTNLGGARIIGDNASVTFTLTEKSRVSLTYGYYFFGDISTDVYFTLQLEKGSTATTYEPYQSTSYPVNLGVENLFDIATNTNGKVLASDGTITDDVKFTISDYIKVLPNTKYTISWVYDSSQGSDTAMRVGYYQSDKTFISRPYNTTSPYTITTPNNCYYIRICYHIASHSQIQVELGDKANSYTPYGTTPIELCKIGDYQDKIAKSTGKNLFDDSVEIKNAFTTGNVGQQVGYTNSSATYTFVNYTYLQANTTYTISWNKNTPHNTAARDSVIVDANNIILEKPRIWTNNSETYTFTPTHSGYLILVFDKNSTYIQIEQGSTATSYEPYGKVWYLNKQIGKVVLNGSETWDKTNNAFVANANSTPNKNSDRTLNSYSNYFIHHYYASGITSNMQNGEFGWNADLKLAMRNDNCSTYTDFKAWLSTHNTIVYYVLATPTTTEITDTTLIEQLDNLENAYSYDTQTNISQENDDKPFIISASALMSLKYIFGNLETRVAELEG